MSIPIKLINIAHQIYFTDLSVKRIYVCDNVNEVRVVVLSDIVSTDFTTWEIGEIKFALTNLENPKIPTGWNLKMDQAHLIERPPSINALYEITLKHKKVNVEMSERLKSLEQTEGFFEVIHMFLCKLGYITPDGKYVRTKPTTDQEIMKSLGYT